MKKDHIGIIVGGPGNCLYKYYYYLVGKDLNFVAESTSDSALGFLNLRRHKP
jgi:hypothetical protein